MEGYYSRGYSSAAVDCRRRLERAKRARLEKRRKVERALLAGGWRKVDGIWVGKDWSH